MENLLMELAKKREALSEIRIALQELIKSITESKEYKELSEKEKSLKQETTELESSIKDEALFWYRQTGNKKPCDGVGIRVMTRVNYNSEDAIDWCITQLPSALTINEKTFERVIKQLQDVPEFVSIEEYPTTTISSDLSCWRTSPM